MKTATGTGTIAAGLAAARGESIEEIRARGSYGDQLEMMAGALAGIDPRRVGQPPHKTEPESATPAAATTTTTTQSVNAASSFSSQEMAIINEVRAIPREQLRAAFAAGKRWRRSDQWEDNCCCA